MPATPESREALYDSMGKTIDMFSPILKEHIILKNLLDENDSSINSKIHGAFLSLCIYSEYTSIELASVLRASFRANLDAEKRYNIKWINCVILEDYKYLYGYGSQRKKSLWLSDIKPALKADGDTELVQDLDSLELCIIEFGDKKVTNKEMRDLSFHYDLDPVSVYSMLRELNEEDEVQRLISFMRLLDKILSFTSKYIKKYNFTINKTSDRFPKYAFNWFEYDIFRNTKDLLLSESEKLVHNNSQRLDDFIKHQGIPAKMLYHFKELEKESIASIYKLVEIEKVAMQLLFLYIDLASAIKAFLTAEYPIERQLLLKQVNVIIYEGLNKIYNLNEESRDSFWSMYICPLMLQVKDNAILMEFNLLNSELQDFRYSILSNKDQRQSSVHLSKGVEEVYSMLDSLNPLVELKKSLDIFNFLPKLLRFLTMCLNAIGINDQIIHEQKMAPTYEKIDNIIQLLKKSPDSEQKEDLIRKLEDIKSGKVFDELMRKKRN